MTLSLTKEREEPLFSWEITCENCHKISSCNGNCIYEKSDIPTPTDKNIHLPQKRQLIEIKNDNQFNYKGCEYRVEGTTGQNIFAKRHCMFYKFKVQDLGNGQYRVITRKKIKGKPPKSLKSL